MSDDDSKLDKVAKAAKLGASFDTVSTYGSAIKEHFFAYSGVDNENGIALKNGLKDIAKFKVNPEFAEENIKQQSGFAAENIYTARENAKHIINKDGIDVENTDLKNRGAHNTLFDHQVLKDGIVIDSQQMKFVGDNAEECLNKLTSQKYQKYIDADATFTLPHDYFELDENGISKIDNVIDGRIDKLQSQIDSNKLSPEELSKHKESIEKLKKIKSKIKDSGITKEEALEARLNPEWSTAKDVVKLAHEAGVAQAKMGAIIGGSVSLVKNCVELYKGEIELKDAAKDVAKTTAISAGVSYGTTFTASILKGSLQNSEKEMLRTISKTNLPAAMVSLALESSKALTRFFSGKTTSMQCLEELGQTGMGMVSSATFATLGQIAIPIPVVGAMVGSMVGYALSSASYGILLSSLKEAHLARENRIRIERECNEHIQLLNKFRQELNAYIEQYLSSTKALFTESFAQIKQAYALGDVDGFIDGCNRVSEALGKKSQFSNFNEFDDIMKSDESIDF